MDFRLSTPVLTATGPTVSFTVTNDGPTPHNVAVRDANGNVLMTTRDLSRGESQTISAEIPPGTYVTFCSLPGHESLGVKGTLTVTSP
jgi:plastocyanin